MANSWEDRVGKARTVRDQLELVEERTSGTSIVQVAGYRRRNLYMTASGKVYIVGHDGIDEYPDLLTATRAIDDMPDAYPPAYTGKTARR